MTASCATTNIEPGDTSLYSKNGIVITRLISNVNNIALRVYHNGDSFPSADYQMIRAPKLLIFKMRSGKAHFGSISSGYGVYGFLNNAEFVVEAGKINYIGDLSVEWDTDRMKIKYGLYNDESVTIGEARKTYPELFEKYPYVNASP